MIYDSCNYAPGSRALAASVSRVQSFVIQVRGIFCHKKWPHIIFMNVVILWRGGLNYIIITD